MAKQPLLSSFAASQAPDRHALPDSSQVLFLCGHGRPTFRGLNGCRGWTLALTSTRPHPPRRLRLYQLPLTKCPGRHGQNPSHSKTLSSFSSFTTLVAIHRVPALSSHLHFIFPFVVIVCRCLFLRYHFVAGTPIPHALPLAPARFESDSLLLLLSGLQAISGSC